MNYLHDRMNVSTNIQFKYGVNQNEITEEAHSKQFNKLCDITKIVEDIFNFLIID